MSTVDVRGDIVRELSEAISAANDQVDDNSRAIAVSLYQRLAQGEPVTTADLAADAGLPEPNVAARLKAWPGVFWDDQDRVVGFWGLALAGMDIGFQVEGEKRINAWCALDPFLIVPVIGHSARVEAKDPVTGETITMTVTPQGIKDLAPASTVVSFITPDKPFDFDVLETFCNFVLYFRGRESAERWASERAGVVLLPAADAFEVGRRAWSKLQDPKTRAASEVRDGVA